MAMAKAKSFDGTVRKLCNKKISDPEEPILGEQFTVEQAIAAAVIKRAVSGATDSVKLIREILESAPSESIGQFSVNIKVVE